MTYNKIRSNGGGLIRNVILIIALLIILGYFGLNLRNIVNSPVVQDNLGYAKELTIVGWSNYLKSPATYAYNLYIRLIWDPAITALERMKAGGPAILPEQSPTVPQPPQK
jgi:hypothetical protein